MPAAETWKISSLLPRRDAKKSNRTPVPSPARPAERRGRLHSPAGREEKRCVEAFEKVQQLRRAYAPRRVAAAHPELRAELCHLTKGFEGFRLGIIDIKNREQFRDLQQIAHPFGQVCQLDRTSGVKRAGAQGYERSESTRIDVVHLAKIKQDAVVLR